MERTAEGPRARRIHALDALSRLCVLRAARGDGQTVARCCEISETTRPLWTHVIAQEQRVIVGHPRPASRTCTTTVNRDTAERGDGNTGELMPNYTVKSAYGFKKKVRRI